MIKVSNEFVEQMLDWRWSHRLTQTEFAKLVGVSRQQMWTLEHGVSSISQETYEKVKKVTEEGKE